MLCLCFLLASTLVWCPCERSFSISDRWNKVNFDWSQVPHLRHLSIKAQFCLRKSHLTCQLHTNQITDKRLVTPKHLIWTNLISINPETFSSSLWNSETIQNKSASFEAPVTSQYLRFLRPVRVNYKNANSGKWWKTDTRDGSEWKSTQKGAILALD